MKKVTKTSEPHADVPNGSDLAPSVELTELLIITPETGDLLQHPVLPGVPLLVGDLVDLEALCRAWLGDLVRDGVTDESLVRAFSNVVTDEPDTRYPDPETRRGYRMMVHVEACHAIVRGVDKYGEPAEYQTDHRLAAAAAILGQNRLLDAPTAA